jgi:hypothetical protein
MTKHGVRFYEQGKFTTFWLSLDGGNAMVDIHIDRRLVASESDVDRVAELVSRTVRDVDRLLSELARERIAQEKSQAKSNNATARSRSKTERLSLVPSAAVVSGT